LTYFDPESDDFQIDFPLKPLIFVTFPQDQRLQLAAVPAAAASSRQVSLGCFGGGRERGRAWASWRLGNHRSQGGCFQRVWRVSPVLGNMFFLKIFPTNREDMLGFLK
jgi:hypothetical protein